MRAALLAEPGDVRVLEGLASVPSNDAAFKVDGSLRVLQKLARGRSLFLQGRYDEAQAAFVEARSLADGREGRERSRLAAQARYRLAEVEEARSEARTLCGNDLGLHRLAVTEGRQARERVQRLATRYRAAVQSGERFWARRAAFRIAAMYDDLYRRSLEAPKTLRAVTLPSPFVLAEIDTSGLLEPILGGEWPKEIVRLYGEVIGSVDARDPDPALVRIAQAKAASFGRLAPLPPERVKNPWLDAEHEGLIRFNRRFERKAPNGQWLPIDAAAARKELAALVEGGPGTVDHAYALVALAEAGPAPDPAAIAAAIGHSDARVRLAGLIAAEKAPAAALVEPIVAAFTALPSAARGKLFASVERALYGEGERALLALRAIAAKERPTAEKLVADERLPKAERVWIVAEIGEARLAPKLQTLARDEDPIVAARAIFATYLAQSRSVHGVLRPTADGAVGCVSRAIQSMSR